MCRSGMCRELRGGYYLLSTKSLGLSIQWNILCLSCAYYGVFFPVYYVTIVPFAVCANGVGMTDAIDGTLWCLLEPHNL